MTIHISIPIEPDELELARQTAVQQGIPLGQYLHQLVRQGLPSQPSAKAGSFESLFGMIGADEGEPTDIARDKDKLIGEAVWKEHLRKTRLVE